MTNEPAEPARTVHTLGSYPGAAPEVGAWLWALQETRRGLLSTLERTERAGFGQEFLDWRGPGGDDNPVGTLLYHVAGVEMGWLYFDMLMTGLPDDVKGWFPLDDREEGGRLRRLPGISMAEHKERLEKSRQRFLEVVSELTLADWNEPRSPEGEDYSATPGWIVFHLVEHEAGHLYEIRRMVRKWRERGGIWRSPAGSGLCLCTRGAPLADAVSAARPNLR